MPRLGFAIDATGMLLLPDDTPSLLRIGTREEAIAAPQGQCAMPLEWTSPAQVAGVEVVVLHYNLARPLRWSLASTRDANHSASTACIVP